MSIIRALMVLPFLLLMVLAYAAMTFLQGDMAAWLTSTAMEITSLPSSGDGALVLSNGDMMVLIGLVLLALEMIKSTNTRGFSLGNHGLSMLVFVVAVGLFLVAEGFATATFLLLTTMTLLDVLVGMLVTIVTARRDIGLGGFDASA